MVINSVYRSEATIKKDVFMNKKNIGLIIRMLGGFCFLALMSQSRNFIADNKAGLCFNLVCCIIALILFTFRSKGNTKEENKTVDKKKRILIKMAIAIGIVSFVVATIGLLLIN